MLNNSPWAREVMLAGGPAGGGGGGGTGGRSSGRGGMGGGGGMGGSRGGMDGGEAGPMGSGGTGGGGIRAVTMLVRWTSSLPVKQAMIRLRLPGEGDASQAEAMLAREEQSYVLTPAQAPGGNAAGDPVRLREMFLRTASLNRKGKESIKPSDVEAVRQEGGGFIVALIFPKTDPITLEDKDVEFAMRLGQMQIKRKFSLKEMVYEGKLQL